MAIWQYPMFILPEEEVTSYFGENDKIDKGSFDEIDWWKYRQLSFADFSSFENILRRNKSWSNNIMLFGDEDANNIEILLEHNRIVEVSVRIDLRTNYHDFVFALCVFAENNSCVFINYLCYVLHPKIFILQNDIGRYKLYDNFMNKLKE